MILLRRVGALAGSKQSSQGQSWLLTPASRLTSIYIVHTDSTLLYTLLWQHHVCLATISILSIVSIDSYQHKPLHLL